MYYEYDSGTNAFKKPVNLLYGFGAVTKRLAGVNGVKLPGTGRGLLAQNNEGRIDLRLIKPESNQLGSALTVYTGDKYHLVGSADLNQDGEPDLVLREIATGFPAAKFGTGDSVNPFKTEIATLSMASFWKDKDQLFAMDDYVGGKPKIGYRIKTSNNNMMVFNLNGDGKPITSSSDPQAPYTATWWANGERILMSNDY